MVYRSVIKKNDFFVAGDRFSSTHHEKQHKTGVDNVSSVFSRRKKIPA